MTLILLKSISTTTGLWMSGGRREEAIHVIMQHTTKGLSKMYCPKTSQNASREVVTNLQQNGSLILGWYALRLTGQKEIKNKMAFSNFGPKHLVIQHHPHTDHKFQITTSPTAAQLSCYSGAHHTVSSENCHSFVTVHTSVLRPHNECL